MTFEEWLQEHYGGESYECLAALRREWYPVWQAALLHAADLCRRSVCNMTRPEATEAYRLANMLTREAEGQP